MVGVVVVGLTTVMFVFRFFLVLTLGIGVEVVVLALEEVEVPGDEVDLRIPLGHRDERLGRDGGIDIPIHRLDLGAVQVVLQPLLGILEAGQQASGDGEAGRSILRRRLDVWTGVGDGRPRMVLRDGIPPVASDQVLVDLGVASFEDGELVRSELPTVELLDLEGTDAVEAGVQFHRLQGDGVGNS